MDTLSQDLQSLYERDLEKLIENLQSMDPDDLWRAPEGITNSCGVLARHIVGNLNHYIGQQMGNTGYIRDRDNEFRNVGISRKELITDIKKLKSTVADIFEQLKDDSLTADNEKQEGENGSIQKFLIHLYGHLNYHLGQINYLRRIISS